MFRLGRVHRHLWPRPARGFCSGQPGGRKNTQQLFPLHCVVTAPLAALATAVATAHFFNQKLPDAYASWYLRWVAAGTFREPDFLRPWVHNAAMSKIIKEALAPHRQMEKLTLLMGPTYDSGKTCAVLKECHAQQKRGFYVNMGSFSIHEGGDLEKLQEHVGDALIHNREVQHTFSQRMMRGFLPTPRPEDALSALGEAFRAGCEEGGLVLVVEQVHVLANRKVQASGIFSSFCRASAAGPVLLLTFKHDTPTHLPQLRARLSTVHAPAATPEEMLPYARKLFGESEAQRFVDAFGGSFSLMHQWTRGASQERPEEIVIQVPWWRRWMVHHGLHLADIGRGDLPADQAARTAEAMIGAAQLAFDWPVEVGVRDLMDVDAVRLETREHSKPEVAWTAPIMRDFIMEEALCNVEVQKLMKQHATGNFYSKFEEAITGQCPVQK